MATTSYAMGKGDVYYQWVRNSNTYSTTDTVWYNWNDSSTTDVTTAGGTSTTDGVWESWIYGKPYQYTPTLVEKRVEKENYIYRITTPIVAPKKSVEEERAIKVQHTINRVWRDMRIAEEKERKENAELTAQKLLEDLIGTAALAHYKETGRLVVNGRRFDYVLYKGRGVRRVKKDKVVDLCVHLKNRNKFPETDNIIGLKLLIESNEREFLQIANNHGELYNSSSRDKAIELVRNHNSMRAAI